jgi:hypothetical protein
MDSPQSHPHSARPPQTEPQLTLFHGSAGSLSHVGSHQGKHRLSHHGSSVSGHSHQIPQDYQPCSPQHPSCRYRTITNTESRESNRSGGLSGEQESWSRTVHSDKGTRKMWESRHNSKTDIPWRPYSRESQRGREEEGSRGQSSDQAAVEVVASEWSFTPDNEDLSPCTRNCYNSTDTVVISPVHPHGSTVTLPMSTRSLPRSGLDGTQATTRVKEIGHSSKSTSAKSECPPKSPNSGEDNRDLSYASVTEGLAAPTQAMNCQRSADITPGQTGSDRGDPFENQDPQKRQNNYQKIAGIKQRHANCMHCRSRDHKHEVMHHHHYHTSKQRHTLGHASVLPSPGSACCHQVKHHHHYHHNSSLTPVRPLPWPKAAKKPKDSLEAGTAPPPYVSDHLQRIPKRRRGHSCTHAIRIVHTRHPTSLLGGFIADMF